MEVPDSVASVDLEVNKEGNVPEEENGKGCGRGRFRGKGEAKSGGEGLGSEVPASIASVNSEVNMETNVSEVGVQRGRSRGKDEIVLQKPEVNSEISENAEGMTEKGGPVSKRRTRSSKNEEDKVETVGESSQKTGDVEHKSEPPISLRRTTRSRGMKNKDNSALISALERIPEASQLEGSMNCEGLENVTPTEKPKRRGRKKNEVEMDSAQNVTVEDKGSEEEHNEGEQISRESMHNIVEEEDERGTNGLISEQETCHESEIAVIKPEPQSNVEGN